MPGLSDVNEPVPHRCVRIVSEEEGTTDAEVKKNGSACRLCGLCVKVLEAFASGRFPALFQGARDDAQHEAILKEVAFWTEWNPGSLSSTMVLSFMGSVLQLLITRESDADDFSVEGVFFPYPDYIEQHYYGKDGCRIAPVPRMSNRCYSEKSLGRAKAWLHHCLDHHSCGISSFYPKRLLDLRGDRIRLFETNNAKELKGPYVCLSHRWGNSGKRLTSTVLNIHNHMNGIPWEEIPKTFQDAITVCQYMSVNYIWIDTVCILQEYDGMPDGDATKTKADFAAENSAMARIYQNSYFTICASTSTNMDSGIFPAKYDHRIKVTTDDGNEASLRIRVGHSHKTPPTDLETRGWTYQEYLLPPRILDFGPFDISWRCERDHLCECAAETFTTDWGWRGELVTETRRPENAQKGVEQWWLMTVRHYAARKLTKHQDKLPALSGLAQIYHEVTNHTYLAGLWKDSLPHNLCWYHVRGKYYESDTAAIGICRRPRQSRAPSWSWASLDALHNAQCRTWWPGLVDHDVSMIYYDPREADDVRQVCKVYEVAVQPRTGDPFGEVSPGGFLKLGVTPISAKIDTKAQGDELLSDMNLFSGSVAWTLNHFDEDDTSVRFCLPDCELDDECLNIGDESDCGLDDNRLKIGDEVYCAPILERLSEERSERGCLVLKRLKDHKYQRVGFCILIKENPNYDYWARKKTWEPNAPENTSYALQWSQDTETQIIIL